MIRKRTSLDKHLHPAIRQVFRLMAILTLLGSCSLIQKDKSKGSDETETRAPGIRVVKEYYPDGKLKSETEDPSISPV